ncbi:MAG: hypothetical protein V4736_11375 [Bdellovibrionota bacterium]
MKRIFVLLFFVSSCVLANSTFLEALKSFQDKDFPAAEKHYVTLLKENPEDPALLTNMGLTQWELQKKGAALGYFRHALNVNPSFEPALKALNYSLSQFPIETPTHDSVMTEWLHENIFVTISTWGLALVHLFTFVGLFWCLLNLAKRKQDDGRPTAGLLVMISVFGVLWILSLAVLILKVADQMKVRGTVIVNSTSAMALPDPKSVPLLELKEGVDVVVRQTQKDWVQVNFPGAASGWIPASNLYIHQKGM